MSLNRSKPIQYHEEILNELRKNSLLAKNIIGIDFSGDVRRGSFEDFQYLIEEFRQTVNGNVTIHAPEISLFIDENKFILPYVQKTRGRVGHFIYHTIDDAKQVIDKKIPIECCPSSNYVLLNINSWEDLHIKKLINMGLQEFSVSTDDVLLFDSTLSEEWTIVAQLLGWDVQQVYNQIRQSVKYAFCDNHTKSWILDQIN